MKKLLFLLFLSTVLVADFIRDNSKEIVLDTTTNLLWQDSNESKTVKTTTLAEAVTYCENLTLGAYSDWSLPNINELKSLVDRSKRNPAISYVFQNVNNGYYVSSTRSAASTYVMAVDFSIGSSSAISYGGDTYIRCVRIIN